MTRPAQNIAMPQPDGIVGIVRHAARETVAALGDMPLPVRQRFLTNDPAAEYIGLHPVTLCIMRRKGTGPKFRRLGKRILYDVADLDAFVESHALEGGEAA